MAELGEQVCLEDFNLNVPEGEKPTPVSESGQGGVMNCSHGYAVRQQTPPLHSHSPYRSGLPLGSIGSSHHRSVKIDHPATLNPLPTS